MRHTVKDCQEKEGQTVWTRGESEGDPEIPSCRIKGLGKITRDSMTMDRQA